MSLRLMLLLSLACVFAPLHAEPRDKTDAKSHEADKHAAAPTEKSVVTHHVAKLEGRSLDYVATAGTLIIRNDKGEPDASMFYVAYTVGDAAAARKRPVTFLYNGGPGSSSIWLHLGSFGPMRVETASPQATPPAPYRLVPNPDSLLDRSDLVFIDAIGTGFSHGVPGEKDDKDKDANPDKRFWGTDQDIDAFGRFVQRYITVNQRWNSPKFLFGESYGTPRSAGLALWLQEHGIACNGVVLLSSILNYAAHLPGLDINYVNFLPSYAASAWYHDKLPNKPATLEPFLTQVRDFARGEYQVALAKGAALPDAERDAIAEKLHGFTGLDVAYLKNADLRVSPGRFRKQLLRGERRTVGRYDARFEGVDADAAGEDPETDPSSTGISAAFISAFNDYLQRDLHYSSDQPYAVSAGAIREWDWKHKAPDSNRPLPLPIMVADLGLAMRENPHLKVLSANGWFDLATPFFATEYDIAHLGIDAKLRDNVTFTYYPSGHMVYLNLDASRQMRRDLETFYAAAAPR